MRRTLPRILLLVLVLATASACGSGQSFPRKNVITSPTPTPTRTLVSLRKGGVAPYDSGPFATDPGVYMYNWEGQSADGGLSPCHSVVTLTSDEKVLDTGVIDSEPGGQLGNGDGHAVTLGSTTQVTVTGNCKFDVTFDER
jgi:hypothetical protein